MLSHYKLVEKIGEGGMGEVYRAHDTNLNRDVALKLLPEAMSADSERRARFQREAHMIAALKHPNIVTIHSAEEADGRIFLTMELVEGQSLSEMIPPDGMTLERFFAVAIEVADAVAYAHAKGITHRDLKPDNIMRDAEGRMKVLDFGLAKLFEGDADEREVTLARDADITQEGLVLGTAAYMSPEQAEGKSVDARSDVFSLGVIFYQMLTGDRPFKGDTTLSTITAILRDTPPSITERNRTLPRHLGRIVRRSLEKDPQRRYQSALDLRVELEEFKREIDSGELNLSELAGAAGVGAGSAGAGGVGDTGGVIPAGIARAPSGSQRKVVWALGGAVVVLLAAVVYMAVGRRPAATLAPHMPTPVQLTFEQLTQRSGIETYSSLSPDGNYVVYQQGAGDNQDIFLQRIGGQKPINLTADNASHDEHPAFSPDGQNIAFRSDRQGGGIFVMGATGESVRRVSDEGSHPSWSPDGKELVYAIERFTAPFGRTLVSALWAVDVATGAKRKITDGDAVQPNWSPHGHRIAYWRVEDETGGWRDIVTVRADGSGDPVSVTTDAHVDWNPVWSPDGRWLYFASDRGGSMNLWRVPIDEESGETLGEPQALTTPAQQVWTFCVSPSGDRVVFTSSSATIRIEKVAFDAVAEQVTGPIERVTDGSIAATHASVSPDGEWVAFRTGGGNEDLVLVRPDGSDLRNLTDDAYRDRGPSWSPDSERIVFYSDRSGRYEIWSIHRDGSGLQQLTQTTGRSLWFPAFAPDGRRVAANNEAHLVILDVSDPPVATEAAEFIVMPEDMGTSLVGPAWSPDGEHLVGSVMVGTEVRGAATYSLRTKTFTALIDEPCWPRWLSDGRRVLCATAQGELKLIDTETLRTKVLLSEMPLDPDGTRVSLPADDSVVYFDTITVEGDLWMATLRESIP